MGKKKTVFVWILLGLLVINFMYGLVKFISKISNSVNVFKNIYTIVSFVVGVVITVIFFIKLYNVRQDVIKWLHIYFSYLIFDIIFSMVFDISHILSFSSEIKALLFYFAYSLLYFIELVLYIFMWIGINMYLKRAQREKLIDFS